jgi:hypothetical protein
MPISMHLLDICFSQIKACHLSRTMSSFSSQHSIFITFLSNVEGVLLPFQELRAVNRENTHSLAPKALQWPNFGHCCFGHVLVIRRCDMIFWEFYGR